MWLGCLDEAAQRDLYIEMTIKKHKGSKSKANKFRQKCVLAVFYSDTLRLSFLGYQSISQIAYLVNMPGMNNKTERYKVKGTG